MAMLALSIVLATSTPTPGRATAFFDSLRRVNTVQRQSPAKSFLFLRPLARSPAPTVAPPDHESVGAEGISCVPFARAQSGINLRGNAAAWWDEAAGVYSRGNRPERGSVLVFPATERMVLGHVSVVATIAGPRLITIDHANWSGDPGSTQRAVPVMDVSPANDWTQVRVGLWHDDAFGSPYATNGFIYNRPDHKRPNDSQISADASR